MSGTVNKAILVGNLGKDPEIRYTPAGAAVANFSIATSDKWTDKSTGEKKEDTQWHRIVCFNRLAELAGEYLVKGKSVYVEGKIKTRSWEKDGVTHYMTEIVASSMVFLGSGGGKSKEEYQAEAYAAAAMSGREEVKPIEDIDDDIPF